MPLASWEELFRRAEGVAPVGVAVAGGADVTVLQALREASDRGWVRPIVVGDEQEIRRVAGESGVDTQGLTILDSNDPASVAVAQVRSGAAGLLMKGRIATPLLMKAILDPQHGLRGGRTICQVVLLEIHGPPHGLSAEAPAKSAPGYRRFLMADTGICIQPTLEQKADILRHLVAVGQSLGAQPVHVAVMAGSETVSEAMPETLDAAELACRAREGEFPGAIVQGPLSFDLAYAPEAGDAKRVPGPVVGNAEAMLMPALAAANLAVKAIMYTADSRFGGILCGAVCPVVFMSRADSTETRLRSLALALSVLIGTKAL